LRPPNVFSGPYLDRDASLRGDAALLEAARSSAESLLVPLWHARNLVRRGEHGCSAGFVEVTHEIRRSLPDSDLVLLGRFRGRVCFAAELGGEAPPTLPSGEAFEDLRVAGGLLPVDEAALLAYARAMILWRRRHRYCGRCGAPAASEHGGHVMKCTRPDCGSQQVPRLDPAVIVLVTDGERALLGRKAEWPPGRYSTIAGFVEPGESLEDAVAREVREETGVDVLDAEYHSSQPWPFPSSLMVAFIARAGDGAVARADEELEDVGWFSRADIAAGRPVLPPPQSVAFRLIEDWYDAGSAVPLRQTAGAKLWGRG
jgi:NAD+ diphosphatase